MIVSIEHRFIFLSMPKCASSALYRALRDEAQVTAYGRPPLKHTPYDALERFILPYLEERVGLGRDDFRVFCVFREPVEWLGSWYRYRTRRALADPRHPSHAHYTGEVSFDEFARAWMCDVPPPYADVGSQAAFVADGGGGIGPDRLFRYDDLDGMVRDLSDLLGRRLRLKRRKVSPKGRLELDEPTRRALRERLAPDYEIYEALGRD